MKTWLPTFSYNRTLMKIERHFVVPHLTPVHYTKFAHSIVWDFGLTFIMLGVWYMGRGKEDNIGSRTKQ